MRIDDQSAFIPNGRINRNRALVHTRGSIKPNETIAQLVTVSSVYCDLGRSIPDDLTIVRLGRVLDIDRAVVAEACKGRIPAWQVSRRDFLCRNDIRK